MTIEERAELAVETFAAGKGNCTQSVLCAWEGDKIFLRLLDENVPFFSLKLRYEGETLAEAKLNGKALEVRHG